MNITNITNDLHYYDIYPKVFPEGKEITIHIKPLGAHAEFDKSKKYFLNICALTEGDPRYYSESKAFPKVEPSFDENGILYFNYTFNGEQMHYIRLFDESEPKQRIFQLAVYSLKPDLCGRYPFVGDLHMHTFRSDGRQAPAIVAANYRKHGYDFLAITDHKRYYPSLEAMNAFKDVPIEYTLVPGEEIHLPAVGDCVNDVHTVNFGGKFSINALIEGNCNADEAGNDDCVRSYKCDNVPAVISKEEYKKQVEELIDELNIPENVNKYAYASCCWIFNNIRKADGLGIFAHPYWIANMYHVPETLTDYMLETKPFDAFEVLGGENYYEQNGLQTAKYYEDRAKGRIYPIVGSTDSHSSVNNVNAFVASTIVFAPENTRESLIKSIKDMYSVAVDGISKEFRIIGDFRLQNYACFLLREFLPLHDDLCYEEGRLMKDYACGDDKAGETLKFISGRMAEQREKYFAF